MKKRDGRRINMDLGELGRERRKRAEREWGKRVGKESGERGVVVNAALKLE